MLALRSRVQSVEFSIEKALTTSAFSIREREFTTLMPQPPSPESRMDVRPLLTASISS